MSADDGVEPSIGPKGPPLGRLGSPFRGMFRLGRGETRYTELWGYIVSFEAELDALEATLADDQSRARDLTGIVRTNLAEAKDQLDQGHVEEAWAQYHGTRELVVFVYEEIDDTEMLAARTRGVYEESKDALSDGAHRTVMALLADEDGVDETAGARRLYEAMRVLHDQYERVALTRRYLQSQFNHLLFHGTASIVLVFLLAVTAEIVTVFYPETALADSDILVAPLTTTELKSVGFALYVVLVGILGASVFGMRTLRDQPLSTQATQRTPGLYVTGARMFVGATSALFLVFALFTGLLNVQESVTAPLALAIAFVGGYSERLAPQAVSRVSQVVPPHEDGEMKDGEPRTEASEARSGREA
jgi:hypothetical protein